MTIFLETIIFIDSDSAFLFANSQKTLYRNSINFSNFEKHYHFQLSMKIRSVENEFFKFVTFKTCF